MPTRCSSPASSLRTGSRRHRISPYSRFMDAGPTRFGSGATPTFSTLPPTPSWTGSRTTRSGSTWARPTCGSAADRPVTIKKHRGQCRPRCPSAIPAVPFRDIRQCSSSQILNVGIKCFRLLTKSRQVLWAMLPVNIN